MRSTNEIVIAVKECQPATEQELRLALVSESMAGSMHQLLLNELLEIMDDEKRSDQQKQRSILLKLEGWRRNRESYFNGHKKPVDEWLGPNHIPGTPENDNLRDMSKAICRKLGIEI